jgi:hypothetical protein
MHGLRSCRGADPLRGTQHSRPAHQPLEGFIICRMQIDPLFVGHPLAKGDRWRSVRPDRMAQLPIVALSNRENLLRHKSGRHRCVSQRRFKEGREPRRVRVSRALGLTRPLCLRRVYDPRLNERHAHPECLHLAGQPLAQCLQSPLGGAVGCRRWVAKRSGHRTDINYRSLSPLSHLWHESLDTPQDSKVIRRTLSARERVVSRSAGFNTTTNPMSLEHLFRANGERSSHPVYARKPSRAKSSCSRKMCTEHSPRQI